MMPTAFTVWLTGLSASGKSTLARELERALRDRHMACAVLDGDVLRRGLCRDLGFSEADRSENIRRVAEVARLMNQAGVIVVTALISPLQQQREQAREIIGDRRFIEVHVSTSLAVCEWRDPKGLYRQARQGRLAQFTGISAPYEVPNSPSLRLDSGQLSSEAALNVLLSHLQEFHPGLR